MTVFWKSKKPWQHSVIYTNSENRIPSKLSKNITNHPLNRSKTDHQHQRNFLISENLWNIVHHHHRDHHEVLHRSLSHHPDIPLPIHVPANRLQQLRQPYALLGIIRPIITRAAAVITTSINTTLVGGSKTFKTTSMDITSTF